MSAITVPKPDAAQVLGKALMNAGRGLGLTQAALGAVVGKDRTAISRGGIDPDSKTGELALLVLRAYRALFALGDRYMSGRHARFTSRGGRVTVTDLDSKNRTFVNDTPLPPHQERALSVGDTVRMGSAGALLNIDKLRNRLGFTPPVSRREALDLTLDWVRYAKLI